MSLASRVMLRELSEYAKKKGGHDFANELHNLFSEMKSISSDEQAFEVRDIFIADIKKIPSVTIKEYDNKFHISVSDRIFRVYCDRNKQNNLFLVVDYWRKNSHYYCYQKLSENLTITSFG